ncbi:XRE family transcriptional regulator [Anaerococcus nagyae]|uniref:LexA family protein n=1 Tax=Anaerococcus nagyae TaxID=1755241 RepID=UPI0032449946
MQIGDKLTYLRKSAKYSQDELARKINTSRSSIAMYESNARIPTTSTLSRYADLFDVSIDYLLGNEKNTNSDKYEVPVYRAVSCGNPFIADEDIVDFEEINPKLKIQGEHFGLRLKGQSMEPNFKEGDVVIVRKQSTVDSGEIAIVRVNGDEATMKIVEISPEGITLIATNPDVFLPRFYSNEEIQTIPVEIIGKVIEQRRKF